MHARVSRAAVTAMCALLAPALAPAQQVWNVTNQTELLAAIAAAVPGDVVQLSATGTFDVFTLDKGLTLRGPATIHFQTGRVVALNIPPGQVAQLVDLTFQTFIFNPFSFNSSAVDVHGTARLDGCSSSVLRLVNANAVIERCVIGEYPSSPALLAQDSVVSVHGCSLHGSDSLLYPIAIYSAPGIVASGSGSLHLSTSTVVGGWGFYNSHGPSPAPAPGIQTSVPTWLTDATLAGGDYMVAFGSGATGVEVMAGTTFHARCTILAGAGFGEATPPIMGNAVNDPSLLGVRMTTPLVRGQSARISVIAGDPGVPLFVVASIGLLDPLLVSFVAQPLWLGNAPVVIASGVSGSHSELSLSVPVPPDPLLENVSLTFVAVRLGESGVQVTPAAGGLIR